METENISGDDTQPQGEDSQATEAFDVNSVINDLLPEFEALNNEQPAPQEEVAEEPAQEAQPEDSPAQETEVAQQETILSAKLAEKARREREERAAREDFEKTKAQAVEAAKEALLDELLNDPQGFLSKYEKARERAGDLALNFYAADLGEDAPDELRQQVGMSERDRDLAAMREEIQTLRLEMQQREIHARNQATIDQYSGFLSDVPADLPYLAVEAQHDQHEALKTMAQVADHMFEQSGSYPSASEVAKAIDRELSRQAARYASIGKPQNVETPQTVKSVKEEPKVTTLSTDISGKSPSRLPSGEDELLADALGYFEEHFSD